MVDLGPQKAWQNSERDSDEAILTNTVVIFSDSFAVD